MWQSHILYWVIKGSFVYNVAFLSFWTLPSLADELKNNTTIAMTNHYHFVVFMDFFLDDWMCWTKYEKKKTTKIAKEA